MGGVSVGGRDVCRLVLPLFCRRRRRRIEQGYDERE